MPPQNTQDDDLCEIADLREIAELVIEPTDSELVMQFVRHQSEDAFAAIVERHGPLVLGVCAGIHFVFTVPAHILEDSKTLSINWVDAYRR